MTRDWTPLAFVYLALAVAGLIGTWWFNALAIVQMVDFLGDLVTSGPAVSSITVDLLVVAVAGSVFIIVEAASAAHAVRLALRRGLRADRVRVHFPAVPRDARAPADPHGEGGS